MITRNNLLKEYPRFNQRALPEALQQEEFDFIAENFDLIDDDEDIAKYVDTFIEKLNEVLEFQQPEKPKSTFTKRDVTAEVLKIADEKERKTGKTVKETPKKAAKQTSAKSSKSSKSSKTQKPKREPKPKKEPKPPKVKKQTGNEVTEFPLPVTFITDFHVGKSALIF